MNLSAFAQFLGLAREAHGAHGFPPLDVTQEWMLKKLTLNWSQDRDLTVVNVMHRYPEASATTVYRRLMSLNKAGWVALERDLNDARVKWVRPTAMTLRWLEVQSAAILKAASQHKP